MGNGMEIGRYLLEEWTAEAASTKRMLEGAPEDRFQWKPHERSRSLGELVQHVATLPSWFLPVFETSSFDPAVYKDPPELTTKAEALRLFDEGSGRLAERLRKTPEPEYDKGWSFTGDGGTETVTKAEALRSWLFDHLIHHRAQMSVYLRLLGVPVPGMYGPSADES